MFPLILKMSHPLVTDRGRALGRLYRHPLNNVTFKQLMQDTAGMQTEHIEALIQTLDDQQSPPTRVRVRGRAPFVHNPRAGAELPSHVRLEEPAPRMVHQPMRTVPINEPFHGDPSLPIFNPSVPIFNPHAPAHLARERLELDYWDMLNRYYERIGMSEFTHTQEFTDLYERDLENPSRRLERAIRDERPLHRVTRGMRNMYRDR